jgi:hypothetical protein
MQPVVERRPNGEDTTTRASPGFEDDDLYAGLVKKIGGAQAGETGANDHNGLVGIERTCGDASNGGRGERKPARRLVEKSSAIHALLFVRLDAVPSETEASSQGTSGAVNED